MDVKSDLAKKRMCIGIAKFYVQIFHVFNSIAHTINPVYSWKDVFGSTVTVDYEHRDKVPKDITPTITKNNLCTSRISALLNKADFEGSDQVEIKPMFCDMNRKKNGSTKNLQEEPGMPELELLYYDVYDYTEGRFKTMSKDMLQQYKKDLETFYKLFTGEKTMNPKVTKFSEILLRDYHKARPCVEDGAFRQGYKGTLKESLFKSYADNIKEMMKTNDANQIALLKILDQIFVFTKDPTDPNKKLIIINPELTNQTLQQIVKATREGIIKLYSDCEQFFFKGLQIFEAIVEKQLMDTEEK